MALAADHLAFGLARLGGKPRLCRLIQPSLSITARRTASSVTARGAATRTRPCGG